MAQGLPGVGGRPRSEPDELMPAITDLASDRRPFRRSVSWIADRLLETEQYEGRNKKKLEERIADNLDFVGYILKDQHPIADDLRSHRERAFDYLCEIRTKI
jgi:hypothetical protein